MRQRRRERKQHDEIARGYEAAGDVAMSRFAYSEAEAQYERALAELSNPGEAEISNPEEEVRLCEKIGQTLFYGARPDLATPWFERVVDRCTAVESLHEVLPAALQLLPRQRWLESRTSEALEASRQARAIAQTSNDSAAIHRSDVSIASWLVLLGCYPEAETYVTPDINYDEQLPSAARADSLAQRAIIAATQGKAAIAFADFDRAIDAAKELPDGYLATVIWDDYANWATALGRLDIARACRERALLVARERRVAWRIPYLTVRFAHMLLIAGDYERARDFIRDALTYDIETPVIRVLIAITGTELAVTLNDDVLLKRTMNAESLELAFQSQEPERIASIVAAYARASIACGDVRRAKTLIARGINAIYLADHAGDVLVLAARYGSRAQAARARAVLQARMQLPHYRIAEAHLALWEANDATRRRAFSESHERAHHAARLFAKLGWKHQQHEALALTGTQRTATRESATEHTSLVSSLAPALTSREQQIAELVLRGLTNRAIASTLNISEHTVERHMTSILNRLGLRSRWQLLDTLQ